MNYFQILWMNGVHVTAFPVKKYSYALKELQRSRLLLVLSLMIVMTSSTLADIQNSPAPETKDEFQKLETCYKNILAQYTDDKNAKKTTLNQARLLYLFGKFIEYKESGKNLKVYCIKDLPEEYKLDREKAVNEVKKKDPDKLAPSGRGLMIDSFILNTLNQGKEFLGDMFNHSQEGHAEYTTTAIEEFEPNSSDFAKKILSISSQSPDLYMWNRHLYHAHTNEYSPLVIGSKTVAINNSRTKFLELLEKIITKIVKYSKQDEPKSLYYLGITVHLIQDLVYHRGMTLKQHAILQFSVKKNPDIPNSEKAAHSRKKEAIKATKALFGIVKKKLGTDIWNNMIKYKSIRNNSPRVEAKRLAKSIYNKEQDMTLGSLKSYYLLGKAKRTIYGDLSTFNWDSKCDINFSVACWDIEPMLMKLKSE